MINPAENDFEKPLIIHSPLLVEMRRSSHFSHRVCLKESIRSIKVIPSAVVVHIIDMISINNVVSKSTNREEFKRQLRRDTLFLHPSSNYHDSSIWMKKSGYLSFLNKNTLSMKLSLKCSHSLPYWNVDHIWYAWKIKW